jgi:hypothetical protein
MISYLRPATSIPEARPVIIAIEQRRLRVETGRGLNQRFITA